jgi:hypothetical protein
MMKTPRWFVEGIACAGYDAGLAKKEQVDRSGKSGMKKLQKSEI